VNNALHAFNDLERDDAIAELMKCCGSAKWAARMAGMRPFADVAQAIDAANIAWAETGPEDWLLAFHHHPKIGEKRSLATQSEQERQWSLQEQSAAAIARAETADQLEHLNRVYEDRFGFIFIVCAMGKSREEILSLLKSRLKNEQSVELGIAAEEQRKIMNLRLEKLL
jgi:OHCU decarboxylase